MFIRIFFSFLFISIFSAAFYSQSKSIDFAELEKTIEAELKETKTPGAALAIVSGDKIVYAKGFGITSVEAGNPVSTDTLFRMGSTTKMFTAAALVSLADAGKIKLDAYEQGEMIFVANAKDEIEHVSLGLYSARKIS